MTSRPPPNYFRDYFDRTDDRAIYKMEHYLDLYHRLLGPWQGRSDITFLEIGIFEGGSIGMWKGFFGPGAKLVFADIDPACRRFDEPGIEIEIGDQADPGFLKALGAAHGPFDLIIDDGGHMMHQQKASFSHLWPHLKDGGLYVVEDSHTSYWPGFGGGFRNPASMIESAKDLVDRMHSWYTDEDDRFPLHPAASQVGSVQFYDSVIVVEKKLKEAPVLLVSKDGKTTRSRRMLEIRGRKSIFAPDEG
jgi:hypothetical protein